MMWSLATGMVILGGAVLTSYLGHASDDPYLWLEEVESQRSMEWVEQRSQAAEAQFGQGDQRYQDFYQRSIEILTDPNALPSFARSGPYLYDFWQDAQSIKGIFRRGLYSDYKKGQVKWETLLDLDALAAQESEDWVFKGGQCLAPAHQRCLISLSRGGADAVVVREYDLSTKTFVTGGFESPEAKQSAVWLDQDRLLISSDFGPGSLTDSGYPRMTKVWQRGQTLDQAALVESFDQSDVGVWVMGVFNAQGPMVQLILRRKTFFESEYHLYHNGVIRRLNVPETATLMGLSEGQVFLKLEDDWRPNGSGVEFSSGSLVALDWQSHPGSTNQVELVYTPDPQSSVDSIAISKEAVYLKLISKVISKLYRAERRISGSSPATWVMAELDLPGMGTVSSLQAELSDDVVFYRFQSFFSPSSQYERQGGGGAILRQQLSQYFDSQGLVTEQRWATSADGTLVPYFLVYSSARAQQGPMPTILYGYGGFKVSYEPFYSGTLGRLWLEKGGAYVLANIRGGGEFGPRWHQAALKENRQRAFDDFISVAEDLQNRNITTAELLGIHGGSNGGLLVGTVMTQRPELFGAVLCQVPLLDMLRYHLLLAGASWVGEYGHPDDPVMRPILEGYSPYHNVQDGVRYPSMLMTTSMRDDRVHPGHARKMQALLEYKGQDVWLYENTKGGHGGASDSLQRAHLIAMQYLFFHQKLMD